MPVVDPEPSAREPTGDAPARDDNRRNTELLARELPAARYVDESYLRWLYDENPYGPAIQRAVDDDGVRVAHYALIPQRYRGPDGVIPAAFSLHAVTRSGTQRKGYFQKLGAEIYAEAAEAGWQLSTGVCNDRSIGAVVKYMGWKTPGPLPVKLCAPGSGRGVTSHLVDESFLASERFVELTTRIDELPVDGYTNAYTTEYLRWRLACPSTSYAIHADDDLVAITTHDTRLGIRAAVILKLFRRTPGPDTIRANAVIGAACRFHRAPYAVYAGFNRHVTVRGVQPPRRLQPSPLHLILRSLSPAVDQDTLTVDTFEFLDMDAY
ncbi:MAG: hypothetical protein QOF40_52 [Actinomycetota bacterium]|nr:hypothetical protein [Actinomycetota bacterium]